ncbi:MAG: hypothetical protein ACK56F_13975, partial [bacterium]
MPNYFSDYTVLIGIMFYLSRLRPRSLYNYAYYSIKMNRTQVEGFDSQEEGSNECGQDQIEPG